MPSTNMPANEKAMKKSGGMLLAATVIAAIAFAAILTLGTAAHAQLVDNPQNLLKTWADAYASRSGDAMARVYSRDAHVWGLNAKEPAIGIDNIKKMYERTGQGASERSVTISKTQILPRKRATIVSGTLEFKSRLKDGTVRNTPARFTMTIVRESRRQWSILSQHVSPLAN